MALRLPMNDAVAQVDLEMMIRRGDHIKGLIAYAHTPDLVQRLHARLAEYRYVCSDLLSPSRSGHASRQNQDQG